MSQSSRILLLGSSGMLGIHLAAALHQRGMRTILHHAGPRFERPKDIWNCLSLHEPSTVVNCMGYTGQDTAEHYRVNACFPRVIADYTQAANVFFVQVSTNAVFADDRSRQWLPNDPLDPQTPYEVAKALGEDPRAYVIRTTFIGASPSGRGIFNRLLAGKSYTDRTWNGVTVWALAHHIGGIILGRDGKSSGGVEHIHSPGITTLRHLCKALGASSIASSKQGASRLLGGGPKLPDFYHQLEEYLNWLSEAENCWEGTGVNPGTWSDFRAPRERSRPLGSD